MNRKEWYRQHQQKRQRRWLAYQRELMKLSFTWVWDGSKWTANLSAHANLKIKHYGRL
jgi:hypothetical protein